MAHIKIGYAPTRRSIFSAPDAIKYRGADGRQAERAGRRFCRYYGYLMKKVCSTTMTESRDEESAGKIQSRED